MKINFYYAIYLSIMNKIIRKNLGTMNLKYLKRNIQNFKIEILKL